MKALELLVSTGICKTAAEARDLLKNGAIKFHTADNIITPTPYQEFFIHDGKLLTLNKKP